MAKFKDKERMLRAGGEKQVRKILYVITHAESKN